MIRQIWRGCHDLPHVGPHPGTLWLCAFVFMGSAASRNWIGGAVMLAIFGPLYCLGAYERVKDSERFTDVDSEKHLTAQSEIMAAEKART